MDLTAPLRISKPMKPSFLLVVCYSRVKFSGSLLTRRMYSRGIGNIVHLSPSIGSNQVLPIDKVEAFPYLTSSHSRTKREKSACTRIVFVWAIREAGQLTSCSRSSRPVSNPHHKTLSPGSLTTSSLLCATFPQRASSMSEYI